MKTKPKLYLVRGLPGSGKSTYVANNLRDKNVFHFEADIFFHRPGIGYQFNPSLLGPAHDWCYGSTVLQLANGNSVAVSNTFTQMWELQRYLNIQRMIDIDIEIVELKSQYQNIHGVPPEKLKTMKDRWEEVPPDIFTDYNVTTWTVV